MLRPLVHVECAHRAQISCRDLQFVPKAANGPARNGAPNERKAARCRRVATRWRGVPSRSLPHRALRSPASLVVGSSGLSAGLASDSSAPPRWPLRCRCRFPGNISSWRAPDRTGRAGLDLVRSSAARCAEILHRSVEPSRSLSPRLTLLRPPMSSRRIERQLAHGPLALLTARRATTLRMVTAPRGLPSAQAGHDSRADRRPIVRRAFGGSRSRAFPRCTAPASWPNPFTVSIQDLPFPSRSGKLAARRGPGAACPGRVDHVPSLGAEA